jgi:hypothetical protein
MHEERYKPIERARDRERLIATTMNAYINYKNMFSRGESEKITSTSVEGRGRRKEESTREH